MDGIEANRVGVIQENPVQTIEGVRMEAIEPVRPEVIEEIRTVTADGRVVVPWRIQRALGLEHGGPIRFRVENGVVTLVSAEPAKRPRQTGVRAVLAAELKTLLDAAERDRAIEATFR